MSRPKSASTITQTMKTRRGVMKRAGTPRICRSRPLPSFWDLLRAMPAYPLP